VDDSEASVVGEARWPMAAAVVATIVFTMLIPSDIRLFPFWLVPSVEALLLVALIAGDPGTINKRSKQLRVFSIVLVGLLAVAALVSTVLLVIALIDGNGKLNSAASLLAAGGIVWACNVLAFALLYWEIDGGGAAMRVHERPAYADFAFVQHVNPDLAPPGWRPRFVDYFYLSVTNATAFSPTDTMPLTPRAKMAMALQAVSSILILGLVIARAVNVLQ